MNAYLRKHAPGMRGLQDLSKKELAEASELVMWDLLFEREMFDTIHGNPVRCRVSATVPHHSETKRR
jgi:hypothetical protein